MTAQASTQPIFSVSKRLIGDPDRLVMVTVAAICLGLMIRVTLGAGLPLWLDETFTGAFASSPSIGDCLYQILQDINAPLYYVVAYATAQIMGVSNAALRFPALVFGCLAPFVCLIPARSIPRDTRLLWCALIALWVPGLAFSQEARCYTLLLLLSVATTIAFVRLLDATDNQRASLWAVFGALAILTHYYALVLVALQGCAYFVVHRRRALSTWRAGLIFLPVLAWLLVHARRIADFVQPDIAWYFKIQLVDVHQMFAFVVGSPVVLLAIPFYAALALYWRRRSPAKFPAPAAMERTGARVMIAVAIFGMALVILVSIWRPLLTPRYLVPFVPGILLGLALIPRTLGVFSYAATLMLVLLFALGALLEPPPNRVYNFEMASEALISAGTKQLVFLWDHPANPVEDLSQLQIVGGFFFKRQGVRIDVKPFKLKEPGDPNPRLLEEARAPDASILWIYHTRVTSTRAITYPPRIAELDPAFRCRDFGKGTIKIVACSRNVDPSF
jgi:hypothetical protein